VPANKQGVILIQRSCEEQQHETFGKWHRQSPFFLLGLRDGSFRGVHEKQGEAEGRLTRVARRRNSKLARRGLKNPFPTFPLKGNCPGGREETGQPGETAGEWADESPGGDASQFATEHSREDDAEHPVESPAICRT
jgi:hypothetical protein